MKILLFITLLNFVAQIPYYLYNYYFPYHVLPSTSSLVLLGVTLVWFLVGYFRFQKKYTYGYGILLSFLIVEVLFYLHSFIFGAFFFQMQNPNLIIKAVFAMGYISGITAGYYTYALIRNRKG